MLYKSCEEHQQHLKGMLVNDDFSGKEITASKRHQITDKNSIIIRNLRS